MTTPVRSSMAEVLLCLKRDSSSEGEEVGPIPPSSHSLPLSLALSRDEHLGKSGEESQSQQKGESLMNNTDTENLPEEITCNCKKSRCLKLYCQCFASQIVCNPAMCKCIQCANTPAHEAEREEAVRLILERNPSAFESKFKKEVSTDGTKTAHKTGCRCRKSMCLKKYCECFNAGVPCSASCTCLQCANTTSSQATLHVGSSIPRSSSTGKAFVKKEAVENTKITVLRAAHDLVLLRNKDETSSSTAINTRPPPSVKNKPRSSVSPNGVGIWLLSKQPSSSCSNVLPMGRTVDTATEHMSGEDSSLNRRKRMRPDSPVLGGGTTNVFYDRPPSILTRMGNNSRQRSPGFSGTGAGKISPGIVQASPLTEAGVLDLANLSTSDGMCGHSFKRHAPPALRITSASPNTLHCASALSLLSGRDMSPQSLSTPSTTKLQPTAGAFFASSPGQVSGINRPPSSGSSSGSSNRSTEKKGSKRSRVSIEESPLSNMLSGGDGCRPHASSLDNTSEEDASISTYDSPYLLPNSSQNLSQGPPPLTLPGSVCTCSIKSQDKNSNRDATANTFNNDSSPFADTVEFFDEGNWTKPVVDVMSKLC